MYIRIMVYVERNAKIGICFQLRLVSLWCLNATFNNISVISWRPALLVEETGVPEENHRPVLYVTDKLYHIMLY